MAVERERTRLIAWLAEYQVSTTCTVDREMTADALMADFIAPRLAEIAALQSRAFEDGARTVALPSGWIAVPRRMTTAMMLAAGSSVGSCDIAHEAYAQAIAAAPILPLQPEGERNV